MLTIAGFKIIQKIYETVDTEIYQAYDEEHKRPVVLKLLKKEYPTLPEILKFRHEYEIGKKIDTAGVVRTYGLIEYKNTLVMVLEDIAGKSLRDILGTTRIELVSFLEIASQLSQALGEIHRKNVIHKDIKPSNIIINLETGMVKITDFSISTELVNEEQTINSINQLEGTLAYMSPEQTGRMNRSVDYRTDFYSLGVAFYEILSGKLPFLNSDPMEQIHCHIARIPVPLYKLDSSIPEVVSGIVMKLLAKNAEERYQSAYGIKADIDHCIALFRETGRIDSFPLGRNDRVGKLQISRKLYGREKELDTLKFALDNAISGSKEILMFTGEPGIGKSMLINETSKLIIQKKGNFISGKFDQSKQDIPYAGFVDAFKQLIRYIMTEKEEVVSFWKERFVNTLYPNARVIIDVIPEVELIIGEQISVPELGPLEAQNRFKLVLQNFVKLFTENDSPLIIFFDDIQWADEASLSLIKLITTNSEIKHLLILGTCQEKDLLDDSLLSRTFQNLKGSGVKINNLEVSSLSLGDVNAFLIDSLQASGQDIQPLAQIICTKTHGNPFFINQFIKTIAQKGLLVFNFDTAKWEWQLEKIKELAVTDNVIDLVLQRIKKLPDAVSSALQLAACVGVRFSLDVLLSLWKDSAADLIKALKQAMEEDLINTPSSYYKYISDYGQDIEALVNSSNLRVVFDFSHERIQQELYKLIDEKSKKENHLRIGRYYLERLSTEEQKERIFDIVNQLNYCTDLLETQKQITELIQLNLAAAKKAKGTSAYSTAIKYLSVGMGLLQDDSWETLYTLAFGVYLEKAECEYLNLNFSEAERLFEIIQNRVKHVLDKVRLSKLRMTLYTSYGKVEETIKLGLKTLNLLGLDMQLNPSTIFVGSKLVKSLMKINGKRIDELASLPQVTDPYKLAILDILMGLTPVAYQASNNFFLQVVLEIVELSSKYGTSYVSAFGYGVYGLIVGSVLGSYEKGFKFGQLGLTLNDLFQRPEVKVKSNFNFGWFISHWRQHAKESIPYLQKAIDEGINTGDLVFSAYSRGSLAITMWCMGKMLPEIYETTQNFIDFIKKMQNDDLNHVLVILQRLVLTLQGLTENKTSFSDQNFKEDQFLTQLKNGKMDAALGLYYIAKMQVYYIYGEYHNALAAAITAEQYLPSLLGVIYSVEYYFYYLLTLIALYPNEMSDKKKEYLNIIRKNQKKLRKWAKNCPANFQHKYLLVEAELARITRKYRGAEELYDMAAESARENDYFHCQAIANELTAKFYFEKGREKVAKTYLLDARYFYLKWGASAKVNALDERYPYLMEKATAKENIFNDDTTSTIFTKSTTTGNQEVLDLATVIKAAYAISSEIILDRLLEKLMNIIIENAGAQRGVLILETDGRLFIQAEGILNKESIRILRNIPVDESDQIPVGIVNYVARSKEDVVLANASFEEMFAGDVYIQKNKPKSILCLPIIHQGKVTGVIYMENNLAAGAFTTERLEVLKLLSSQIAISIENARLYGDLQETSERLKVANDILEEYSRTLEQKVEERTREIKEKNDMLEETLIQLKAAQNQIVVQEKMASLGALTAGIAHEIKNPLNFVNNFAELSAELTQELREEIEKERTKLDQSIVGNVEDILQMLEHNVIKIGEHGKRADSIIKGMLMHSRGKSGERQLTDINNLLAEYISLAYHGMRAQNSTFNVKIETEYDNTVGQIDIVPQDISRVFLNIISNALYAVHEKDQKVREGYSPLLSVVTKNMGDCVEIRIRDSGDGIPKEVKDKIFEPFFTTKPTGKGTGLGLSISYDIVVQAHKGELKVETEEGNYTEFIIRLPRDNG